MKNLLYPVTLLFWSVITYLSLRLTVIGLLWIFSLSWFWIIIAYTFVIGIVYFISTGVPAALKFLILRFYKYSKTAIILHSVVGFLATILCIIDMKHYFFDATDKNIISFLWHSDPVKFIVLLFPFLGVLFGSLYSNSIGGIEMIAAADQYPNRKGNHNDTEDILSINDEQPSYEADVRSETSISLFTPSTNEVKPIQKTNSSLSEIFYESPKYRVSGLKNSRQIFLHIGQKNSSLPLKSVICESAEEAVFVAEKLNESSPEGLVRDYHNVDNIINNLKQEYEDSIVLPEVDWEALFAQLEENEKAQGDNNVTINPT